MKENIFWDKKIDIAEIKNILRDDKNPRFTEIAALLLSRTNIVKEVFGSFLDKVKFCKNWLQIKSEMRKNKWKDERIIFWDEIYKVVRGEVRIRKSRNKPEPLTPEIKEVGGVIRIARKKRSWTQKELAKNAGVSQQLISFVERGYNNFSFETIQKICSALNLRIVINPPAGENNGAVTSTTSG